MVSLLVILNGAILLDLNTQHILVSSGVATVKGVELPFVANVMLYLVTFIRILQNVYFIYPIYYV